jgi:integrase
VTTGNRRIGRRDHTERNEHISFYYAISAGLVRLCLDRSCHKEEFDRILSAVRSPVWKARILVAKTAGPRRGEVVNLTLSDIDFAKGRLIVQPKEDTRYTWRWVVKDRREVPLVDEVAQLLIDIQTELPEGQPP